MGVPMLRKLIVIAALVLSAMADGSPAFAGDPVGTYSVTGSNPGGRGRYSGSVTVERTGDTFRVTWDIGNQTYIGTGIGSEKGIAVTYRSGNQTGLAIYGATGNNWEGVWTYTGGREVGGEVWTRR
jgi:hypothetical protein